MPIPPNFEVASSDAYVKITNDDNNFLSSDDFYEVTIGITDKEALELYNDYLTTLPETFNVANRNSAEHLADFVEYAVDQGIIEDNAVQRAGITKAIVPYKVKVIVTTTFRE